MKSPAWLMTIAGTVLAALAAGAEGPTAQQDRPAAKSPTGREPKLVWTPRQQAVWQRMRRERHPWWGVIKDAADRTGTRRERYGDRGQWATLAYQITGQKAYAAKAWAKVRPVITAEPKNANTVREYFAEYVLLYDWLYPALTDGQRKEYRDGLNRWCEWCLSIDTVKYKGGFRPTDYDQTVGQYFGLAFVDLAAGGDWLGQADRANHKVPVGGLKATATDRETIRNAVRDYVRLSEGGEGLDGSDYNLGTLKLLFLGARGVKTAAGKDHFPAITKLAPQAALAQLYAMTPDLASAYQWGDVEHPHNLMLTKRMTLLALLAGLTQDDSDVGPYVHQLVLDLVKKYGATGGRSAEPWWRAFYCYNPYAKHADWRGVLPNGYYAPGRGLVYYHDGWGAQDSFLGAHLPPRSFEDHDVAYFGDFQLYRKGEWGVTHPLGYGGPARTGAGTNSMLIAGLSSMRERRGPVAQEFGDANEYVYFAGTTGGQFYDQPYYNPPPTFLHEWTRSLLYLPSEDKKSDTVVVFDRVKADDPRKLPKFDRYRKPDRARIEAAPAMAEWFIHSPVAPEESADGLSWKTGKGQRVQVSTLLPAEQVRRVRDESKLWGKFTSNLRPSELKFHTGISAKADRPWQTFLNVVQVHDGASLSNTLVRAEGGAAEGVLLGRGGHPDVLALFGARESGRLHESGFSARWKSAAEQTRVHLFDLDPEKKWRAKVDQGEARELSVSPRGVAKLTVKGKGNHSLELQVR